MEKANPRTFAEPTGGGEPQSNAIAIKLFGLLIFNARMHRVTTCKGRREHVQGHVSIDTLTNLAANTELENG